MYRFIFFLVLLPLLNIAQTTTSIPFKSIDLKIDGLLEESIWEDLEPFSDFYNMFPNDIGMAKNKTVIKAFHNGTYLFVSATYHDTSTHNNISALKRDNYGESFHGSDNFGIILDPFNKGTNGYYFAINAGGALLDALISNNNDLNISWNTIWKGKTVTNGKLKTYEFAIPFKAMDLDHNNQFWGIQCYMNDTKINLYTTFAKSSRNNLQFDLRFTNKVQLDPIPIQQSTKFTITPSILFDYQDDQISNPSGFNFKPSIDIQYKLTSSLNIDLTVNPDFSQVEVDKQVTNLTRFDVNFPEKRHFFLENSDLFANLGTSDVIPFYSRRVGNQSNIQFGTKISGNISSTTRIGFLDVQTEENDLVKAHNHAVLVGQQHISNNFTTTAYLINKQQTSNFELSNNYNRVTGINLNYKSNNNKWIGLANYGTSFSDHLSGQNKFYNIESSYSTRKVRGGIGVKRLEKNYHTALGFVPRLYQFDIRNNERIAKSYSHTNANISLIHIPLESKVIDSYRYLQLNNDTYWDESGNISSANNFFNNALWFKNQASIYLNIYHDYDRIEYGFDPLQNGNILPNGTYQSFYARIGYNSPANNILYYNINIQYGNYYGGTIFRNYINIGLKLLPYAHIKANYEINKIDLHEFGNKLYHLINFTGEIYFSNQLNWTTYVQYNTQRNNFNINSRLQWEYSPLSYVYIVFTNNYDDNIAYKDWGVSLKFNYRFHL